MGTGKEWTETSLEESRLFCSLARKKDRYAKKGGEGLFGKNQNRKDTAEM